VSPELAIPIEIPLPNRPEARTDQNYQNQTKNQSCPLPTSLMGHAPHVACTGPKGSHVRATHRACIAGPATAAVVVTEAISPAARTTLHQGPITSRADLENQSFWLLPIFSENPRNLSTFQRLSSFLAESRRRLHCCRTREGSTTRRGRALGRGRHTRRSAARRRRGPPSGARCRAARGAAPESE
jgi:hypothetical protein